MNETGHSIIGTTTNHHALQRGSLTNQGNKMSSTLSIKRLIELWGKLGDVPVTKNGEEIVGWIWIGGDEIER